MLDVNREATTDMWVWIQSYTNILASGDSDSFDHLWYEIEISDCSQTFGPDWLPKRKSEQQPLPRGHLRLKSETLWRRCEIEIWHWVKAWNWVKGWGGGGGPTPKTALALKYETGVGIHDLLSGTECDTEIQDWIVNLWSAIAIRDSSQSPRSYWSYNNEVSWQHVLQLNTGIQVWNKQLWAEVADRESSQNLRLAWSIACCSIDVPI